LFDPLYEEFVTNLSELILFLYRHFFIELFLPLSLFVAVMLTFIVDWSWIPISNVEKVRGNSLKEIKKRLID